MISKSAQMVLVAGLTMILTASGSASAADPAQAQACATGLSPEARMIYEDVAPLLPSTTALPDLVRERTRNMVMSGKLNMSIARDSAKEAGNCLKLLQS